MRLESVVTVTGKVVKRSAETVNPKLPTGEIELRIEEYQLQSAAELLPLQVNSDEDSGEDMRLTLPLPRSAARAHAPQHHAALQRHRQHPPAHGGAGLHRVPDADPDRELARGRARLPGAEPHPSRQVLRPAAGAAAVQAAADDRRLRPLFPDRALLPRRGRPRRPLARASSTSSISRCPSSPRTTSSPRSSRCCTACSRSSRATQGHAAALPAHRLSTRRC